MDEHQVLRFGRFILDSARGRVLSGGVDVELRPKSYEVLCLLVHNAGRVVTKDELALAVWPGVVVTDDSLVQCVHDIRKALGDDGALVKTVPRRGYVFLGDVESRPEALAARPRGRAHRWLRIAAGGLASLLLAALAGWTVTQDAKDKGERGLAIAVLPFASIGPADERHFSDGLSEDIITAISRFRDVTVIARNSSFRFRAEPDVARIGRELNTSFVVKGSVGRDQERVRINVQLVDVRSGATRWAERYDRPLGAVFELQDEVAEQLVAKVVGHARHVAAERVRARNPTTLHAYELVLRARQGFVAFNREGAVEALALLQQAVALDPAYAPAWELLARVLLRFHIVPYDERFGSADTLAQAHQVALKALALDPNLSLAHGALGYAQLWMQQYGAAQASLERAIALNPNDADTLRNYGDALGKLGKQQASIQALERSRRLDPFTPPIALGLLARAYNMVGEHEKALPAARECAERTPGLPMCSVMRAIAAARLGYEEEAKAAVRQLLAVDPKGSIRRWSQPRRFVQDSDQALWTEHLRVAGLPD